MKFLLVWLFYGAFKVPFVRGEQPRWRAGHSYPRPLPQEIMVDAVNYIGLVLLQAHNQNNENNIALSPYGATSVLVALGEGLQGTALNEILQATLLPLDVSVTRVGLRDIHRHLKSYFIPQEGFLAGLTFSHENVTLKSSYEDILRFYGYDVDSFNNALYPDPYSTTVNVGSEGTTESLSSVSNTANYSSSTTQTVPITYSTATTSNTLQPQTVDTTFSTLTIPTTTENRNNFNSSGSSTIETTHTVSDSVGSTTTHTTQVTSISSIPLETSHVSTAASQPIPGSTLANTIDLSTLTTAASTQKITAASTLSDITNTRTTTTITVPETTISTTTTTVIPSTTTTTVIPSTTTTTVIPSTTTTTVIPSTILTTSEQPTTINVGVTSGTTTTSSGTRTSTQTSYAPDTTVQITSASSSSITTTSSPSTTYVSTSSSSVAESTITVTTTPVNTVASSTATPLTTTITESTRPTAVIVSVVPSTVGNVDDGTTIFRSSTATTSVTNQNTGPIVINVQPTTFASTSTINSDSTESIDTTETTTPTTVSTSVTTSTISTIVTENPESTPTVSSTLNTEVTTLNVNSESTAFTIDLVPSTVGTATTPSDSTTENSIPTLITPLGDSLDGFQIEFKPSTLGPKSAEILMSESEKSRRAAPSTSRNSLPRFRDNVELMKTFKFENISAVMPKVVNKNLISQSTTSKNAIDIKENLEGQSASLIKNNKDITIDASIGKMSVNPTISSRTDSNDDDNKFVVNLLAESEDITQLNYTTNATDTVLYDPAEIILSAEDTISKQSTDKQTRSADSGIKDEKTRDTRSVIDYLIARYHDNNPPSMSMSAGSSTDYEPSKPATFAVNGKIRESNINFMTYDTVLPFRYISYLNALALTFPLDSTKYYLLLILPLDEMGIDNLVSNMMSTTLKQIIYHLQPTRVKATIPSFMLKGYVVLTPTLQKLGIRQIFEPRHADFSRMTDDKDIYVTNIEQAVTVTIRNYVDPNILQTNQNFRRRGPVQFTADHPFLYFVMDSEIHVALMAGKIINPLNSRIR